MTHLILLCRAVDTPEAALHNIRLVDCREDGSCRVEIQYNSTWGTICDDDFGNRDAMVVCRQLGLQTRGFKGSAVFDISEGAGPIWMDDLRCTGLEDDLSRCLFRGWGKHDCSHSVDVGVNCGIPSRLWLDLSNNMITTLAGVIPSTLQ